MFITKHLLALVALAVGASADCDVCSKNLYEVSQCGLFKQEAESKFDEWTYQYQYDCVSDVCCASNKADCCKANVGAIVGLVIALVVVLGGIIFVYCRQYCPDIFPDDTTYGVTVPPGPLGVQFLDPTCTVHAVNPTSLLLGATLAGDALFSVNGQSVTPTTILDVIKAADDGTGERKLVFRTTAPAMKAEGTPAGMTAGGAWVEQTYVGPQTSQCACLACLCFGLPGLCVLCFPTDKRMVYVNLEANAKPGPGKAALPDGSIVNYSKGGGSGPMIQRGPTAPIITEPGREVS